MRARDAADGLHELALDGSGALDLETQFDEERRRCVEVRHGDADVVEPSHETHRRAPPCLAWTMRSTARGAVRWKSLSRTQVGVTTPRTIESYQRAHLLLAARSSSGSAHGH